MREREREVQINKHSLKNYLFRKTFRRSSVASWTRAVKDWTNSISIFPPKRIESGKNVQERPHHSGLHKAHRGLLGLHNVSNLSTHSKAVGEEEGHGKN